MIEFFIVIVAWTPQTSEDLSKRSDLVRMENLS